MKSLPELIREELDDRDLTYRAVAERAAAAGHVVSYSLVGKYANGRAVHYSREKIVAIAAGLGASPDRLLEAADMRMLGEPFELPSEAALLEPHERDAVRSVVNAFIQNRQRQQGGSREEFEVDKADRANVAAREGAPHRARRAGHDPEWDELYGDYELAAQEGVEGVDPGEVEEQYP